MPKEMLKTVTENDKLIGSAKSEQVYAKGLLHQSAGVVVFDKKGKILVHRRAKNVRLYPGALDVKFGGSVRKNETYKECAKRELFEEAEIKGVTLKFIFKSKFRHKKNNVNRKVFACTYQGAILTDPKEVANAKFMSIKQIEKEKNHLSPSGLEVYEHIKRHL